MLGFPRGNANNGLGCRGGCDVWMYVEVCIAAVQPRPTFAWQAIDRSAFLERAESFAAKQLNMHAGRSEPGGCTVHNPYMVLVLIVVSSVILDQSGRPPARARALTISTV
jgi:hypothetical protein